MSFEIVLRTIRFAHFDNIDKQLMCEHNHEDHKFRSCEKLLSFIKNENNDDFIICEIPEEKRNSFHITMINSKEELCYDGEYFEVACNACYDGFPDIPFSYKTRADPKLIDYIRNSHELDSYSIPEIIKIPLRYKKYWYILEDFDGLDCVHVDLQKYNECERYQSLKNMAIEEWTQEDMNIFLLHFLEMEKGRLDDTALKQICANILLTLKKP